MFCRKCGKIIPADSYFCPECGAQTKLAQSAQQHSIERQQNQQNTVPVYQPSTYQNQAVQSKSPAKRQKKKPRLLRDLILGAVIVFAILFIIIKVANSPSVDNKQSTEPRKIFQAPPLEKEENKAEIVEVETEDAQEAEKQVEEHENVEPEPVRLCIGESGALGDMEITVTDYKFSQYAGGLGTLNKAQDGLSYCVVYVNAKNIGTNALELVGMFDKQNYEFFILYDGENKYGQSWANFSDFLAANETIPSKGTLQGKLLNFSVPVEMQNNNLSLELHLKYNSIWKDEEVIWTLR